MISCWRWSRRRDTQSNSVTYAKAGMVSVSALASSSESTARGLRGRRSTSGGFAVMIACAPSLSSRVSDPRSASTGRSATSRATWSDRARPLSGDPGGSPGGVDRRRALVMACPASRRLARLRWPCALSRQHRPGRVARSPLSRTSRRFHSQRRGRGSDRRARYRDCQRRDSALPPLNTPAPRSPGPQPHGARRSISKVATGLRGCAPDRQRPSGRTSAHRHPRAQDHARILVTGQHRSSDLLTERGVLMGRTSPVGQAAPYYDPRIAP